ncbi:MAG TPA: 50S ribosomal protein L23 [Candidatus Binataceae bacterium]|nr:50S ribosomal protein L23 [Candidatus Binataceae bacterium]
MNPANLILSPVITEKGTMAGEQAGQVVFRVRRQATKDTIRVAVEQLFKVTVVKVRTINFMGKERRRGTMKGRQMNWKKAYVTLKEGDKIEFFEGV